ncbi:carcinine transporter-like [Apis dorsata]|uniref:carcinine transporter-like n=1 Tax=Apis dorsata TaxID=7462 RepID=UPI001293F739|nr:carcinine transporter-like [Apis dorsata]
MLMVFCFFLTFVYFTQLFLIVVPDEFWCEIPTVEGFTSEELRDYMIPTSNLVPYEGHDLPYSRCWIYDIPVKIAIEAKEPDPKWPMKKCHEWYFKTSPFDVPYISVASEFGWVCDDAYKVSLAQSIFFGGSILGGLIFGWLGDKYGRIPAVVVSNLLGFIGGLATIYIHTFWQFCVCRFIVGVSFDSTFVFAYILVLEYVGPGWRTFVAHVSFGLFYTFGAICMPWMAYFIANWRTFALVTTIPLVFVLIAPLFIPESVRWLIGMKKMRRALKIISLIEKINRNKIPESVFEEFKEECEKAVIILAEDEMYTLIDLFKTRRLRRTTILLTTVWGIIQMCYDGHIRCLDALGLDVFSTFTIASITEFPAEMLVVSTLDTFGRRWTLFTAVTVSALFSTFAALVPTVGIAFASFAICSRLFINVASDIALQYAAELLPTVVRGEGVAFIHVMGYVTSIFSPYIAFSARITYNMPMIILAISCYFGGAMCLFLPETLMEQLPQSLVDGELFGIDQVFWETPLTRKKPLEPVGLHMHAKRPTRRPDLLRSSMVSGFRGMERRHTKILEKVGEVRVTRQNQ